MIPVIWLNLHPHECHPKQHWDTAIFQELILNGEEWNCKPEDWPYEAAVVMVAGRFHAEDVEAINRTLGFMDGCVVVIHSDEESLFPWWELDHPRMRRWVMTPHPATQPVEGVRFIGEGWSPGTPAVLKTLDMPRVFDVAFLGQATHPRRIACVNACGLIPFGYAAVTDGFAKGEPQASYLAAMARAKIAPCPTGPVTADSFRIYEALEAGCVPILDGVDGKGRDATNLWHLIFGAQCPLPIIKDWSDLPTMVPALLDGWETRAAMIGRWWDGRKAQWVSEMAEDVKAIS